MPSRPFRAPFTRVMLTAACLACFATAVFAFDADRTPVAVRQYSAPALRKPAHRPIVAGMQAGLPTPYSALRSLDGAWLAANVRM